MTGFEIIVIPILFLEEFVKRILSGIYLLWQRFDHWNDPAFNYCIKPVDPNGISFLSA